MKPIKNVIAICGSTRMQSTQLNLINAIAELAYEKFGLTICKGLDSLPHFNPDLDNDTPPDEIKVFRQTLRQYDGILICTPEYAMGVPGTLKNAIDWTVGFCEFHKKPTALITASSVGYKGHSSLMETLNIIEAKINNDTQLVIPFIKTKVSHEAKITDIQTLEEVKKLINAFSKVLEIE